MIADPTPSSPDKREAILIAAVALFAERGFHGTAVPDIAARARVGAGTIYRYFPGKEALVNTLYQAHKAQMVEAVAGGLDLAAPPRVVFRDFWRRTCVFAREHATVVQFLELQHHAPYLDEASREAEGRLVTLAESFLAEGIRQEVFRDVAPSLLIALVWGAFRGLCQGGCDGRVTLDDATIAASETCLWEAIRR